MKTIIASLIAAAALAYGSIAQAVTVDVVQAPTGFFVPTDAQKYDTGYWRWYNEDWSWSHNAIGGTVTSAWLMISAFDVDAPSEVDNIWVDNIGVGGSPILLGSLAGSNNTWNFTWFDLMPYLSTLSDDIGTGLKVSIDIDSTNPGPNLGWAVTLAKSVLCVNGNQNECAQNPTPGVPEPASLALMVLGLAGLAAARRRKIA